MATSPTAPMRDDDPPHPNFDGISFRATTDKSGVIVTPTSAATMPPVSFIPVALAIGRTGQIFSLIESIRADDPKSYLADFLDDMLDDFMAAIAACKPEPAADEG